MLPVRRLLLLLLCFAAALALLNVWMHYHGPSDVFHSAAPLAQADQAAKLAALENDFRKMLEQMSALMRNHEQESLILRGLRSDQRKQNAHLHVRPVPKRMTSLPQVVLVPDVCEQVWGEAFIKTLRESATPLCTKRAGSETNHAASKLTLHANLQDISVGGFLYGENIAFDYTKIVVPDRSTKKEADEYFRFSGGSITGQCEMSSLAGGADMALNKLHFKDLLSVFQADVPTKTCDVVVEEPVYLVRRYEYANLWHTGVDYFNAFVALRVFNIHPEDWTVMFLDQHPPGALDDPWAQIFSPSQHRPLTGLKEWAGSQKRVCFRKIIVAGPNYFARMSATIPRKENCRGGALAEQYRQFVMKQYGFAEDFSLLSQAPMYSIIVRRPYVAHPRNPSGKVTRKWANEKEILDAAANAGITLNVADFAQMSFADQLNVVRRSSVLIGIHGAALSHALFLPPGAVLMEVVAPERGYHFENLAIARNLSYVSLPSAQTLADDDRRVDVGIFLERLKTAVDIAKRNRELGVGMAPSLGRHHHHGGWVKPVYSSPLALSLGRFQNCQRSSTYIITGGAGFIGSHIVDFLLAEKGVSCVVVLDDLSTGRAQNLAHHEAEEKRGRLIFVPWDIRNPLLPDPEDEDNQDEELLQAQYVFHLASPASPVHYQSDPHFTFTTNVLGMQNVLEYADYFGARVLFSSTSEVYGDPLVHPQEESYWGNANSFGPRSCYDEGKRAGETLCYIYMHTKQLDVRIARIFNTYGPRMALNDGRVVSTMTLQALRSEAIPMHGSGNQTRSFCYVSDMVAGLMALMRVEPRPNTPVNLGNPNEITIAELSQHILDVMAKQGRRSASQPQYMPAPPDDPQRRKPNIALAKRLLNWEPRVPLDEGLALTINYFAGELPQK